MSRQQTLERGRYRARFAESTGDLLAAQHLRYRSFRRTTQDVGGLDADEFDQWCKHLLVEDTASGRLVCCFRLLHLKDGSEIARSYSAQFYDLTALGGFAGPMAEIGRFCIHPNWHDPDILRLAWGAMTAYVDREKVEMLFGCSSFQGTNADAYADVFALLHERHVAPKRWRPQIKSLRVVEFAKPLTHSPDPKRAQSRMPPLLRTYLLMGGWVSDHAVVDTELDTLHVFTGLEIRSVPPARARLLRAVAR